MKDLGLEVDLDNPNADAIQQAQLLMRRSQASAFFKDLPPVLTRGGLTGNVSLDKLILQFQTFMLNRWSTIRYDMLELGIVNADTRSTKDVMNFAFWLTIANASEMYIRRISNQVIAWATGSDEDDWEETFTQKVVLQAMSNVPFVSQISGSLIYGNIPVPAISISQKLVERGGATAKGIIAGDDIEDIAKNAFIFTLLAGGLFTGAPGILQAEQVIRKLDE